MFSLGKLVIAALLINFVRYLCLVKAESTQSFLTSHVFELSPKGFGELLYQNSSKYEQLLSSQYLFVDYSVSWCGYCTNLLYELDQVAIGVNALGLPVNVVKVDMALEDEFNLIGNEKILGYPTLYLYNQGKLIERYNGTRTSKNIINFLKKSIDFQFSVLHVESMKELSELVMKLNYNGANKHYNNRNPADRTDEFNGILLEKNNRIVLEHSDDFFPTDVMSIALFLFPPAARGSNRGIYGPLLPIAQQLNRDCPFLTIGYTDNLDIIDYFHVSDDSIVLLNSLDNAAFQMNYRLSKSTSLKYVSVPVPESSDDSRFSDNLKESILRHIIPPIIQYNSQILPMLRLIPIKIHALVFYDSQSATNEAFFHEVILKNVDSSANNFRGKVIFLLIDVSSALYVPEAFQITAQTALPCVVLVDMKDPSNMVKYRFSDYVISSDSGTIVTTSNAEKLFMESICLSEGSDHYDCITARQSFYARASLSPNADNSEKYREASLSNNVDLKSFFNAFFGGYLPRSVYSESLEQLSALNTQLGYGTISNVENVGAINFLERVLENNLSDVLVYFHAPYCAYCKAVEPVIEQIASHFLVNELNATLVQVVRVNGVDNDIEYPVMHIIGYPAIFLLPAGNKGHPIEYTGDISTNSIISFIDDNRSQHRLHEIAVENY